VFTFLLLLVAASGCGHIRAGKLHGQRHGIVVQTSAQASATLPAGYNPITSLVGDPNGSGVWFWDSTKSDLSVFRVDGKGTMTSWPVLSGTASAFQDISGFTVTSAGIAWLGINSTLTRFDPGSAAARTWQLPAPADNPVAESFVLEELKGQHLVQGIAVAPDGRHVAIAMSHSSSVELFDASAGTFTQIAMPATSDEPVAVAYSPDGTLGIALADYKTHQIDTALIVGPGSASSSVVVRVPDSTSITSDGTSGFIVGSSPPSLVTTSGTATPIIVPQASFIPVHAGAAISITPSGDLTAITSTGVLKFPSNASSVTAATSASSTLQLPAEPCPPEIPSAGGGDSPAPQPSPNALCHPQAVAMTVDGGGGVWVVPGSQAEGVELLAS
jgi:hypothetical protein